MRKSFKKKNDGKFFGISFQFSVKAGSNCPKPGGLIYLI